MINVNGKPGVFLADRTLMGTSTAVPSLYGRSVFVVASLPTFNFGASRARTILAQHSGPNPIQGSLLLRMEQSATEALGRVSTYIWSNPGPSYWGIPFSDANAIPSGIGVYGFTYQMNGADTTLQSGLFNTKRRSDDSA